MTALAANGNRRSFDDPMVYMTKDRKTGIHSYFFSFFIVLVQVGCIVWFTIRHIEALCITDLIRLNLGILSTVGLFMALITRKRCFMVPLLCIYWSALVLLLFIVVYLMGIIVVPELFVRPLLSKSEYRAFLADDCERISSVHYCCRWGMIYSLSAVLCSLPLVTLVKCYNYLGKQVKIAPEEVETVVVSAEDGVKTGQLI